MRFEKRTVIVTGAGSGIGRAIALAYARQGARVMISGRHLETLQETAGLIPEEDRDRVAVFAADVRSEKDMEALVRETKERLGPVDILINNAGIYPNVPVVDMPTEEWDAVMETNLRGPFLLSRAVARQMIQRGQGGKIVNVTSGAYKSARRGAAHYCSSKAALTMFTKVLAMELAEHRIQVNSVSPGLIDVGPRMPVSQEYKEALVEMIPWGRMGEPEEIARAVLFVTSDEAEYITAAILEVDGGALAGRYALPLSEKREEQ